MKRLNQKALCLLAALCFTLTSWGADFVVDGIKYSINNGSVNVTVVANTEKYSGDIVIPATIENLGQAYNVTAIGRSAFEGCTDITSITLNDGVETIGNYAFQNCSKLKSLTLPNSVTSIGQHLCEGCSLLESVVIGDGLKAIAYRAFYNLGNLKTIVLGKKVDAIGENSFAGCKNINTIMCTNTKPATWYNMTTTFSSDIYSTCTLYVPEGSGDIYKAADGWKSFFNIKEGDPTGINNVTNDKPLEIYAADGAIVIKSATAAPFSVYGVNGNLKTSGIISAGETKVLVNAKGIYIVKIASEAIKVNL